MHMYLYSCGICRKKQNLHFIVPDASFKLLQVPNVPKLQFEEYELGFWVLLSLIKNPPFVQPAPEYLSES